MVPPALHCHGRIRTFPTGLSNTVPTGLNVGHVSSEEKKKERFLLKKEIKFIKTENNNIYGFLCLRTIKYNAWFAIKFVTTEKGCVKPHSGTKGSVGYNQGLKSPVE